MRALERIRARLAQPVPEGTGEPSSFFETRRRLAEDFLRGEGIEIGPLHQPLDVPEHARVRYVDRLPVEELRLHYPELSGYDLVEPDVIDDGERLESFADASLDFVIANHFIEHCQDPLGALENHLRVLKRGGVLYLAVPDKRETFDRDRPLTEVAHVLRDHAEGPEWSRRGHFEEYAQLVDKVDNPKAHADELLANDYSIHFHVWTPDSFLELLIHATRDLGLPIELEALRRNEFEFIVVLSKQGD